MSAALQSLLVKQISKCVLCQRAAGRVCTQKAGSTLQTLPVCVPLRHNSSSVQLFPHRSFCLFMEKEAGREENAANGVL